MFQRILSFSFARKVPTETYQTTASHIFSDPSCLAVALIDPSSLGKKCIHSTHLHLLFSATARVSLTLVASESCSSRGGRPQTMEQCHRHASFSLSEVLEFSRILRMIAAATAATKSELKLERQRVPLFFKGTRCAIAKTS